MVGEIRHQGVVDMIDGQTVIVRITQQSACTGCQARSICHAAESKEQQERYDESRVHYI